MQRSFPISMQLIDSKEQRRSFLLSQACSIFEKGLMRQQPKLSQQESRTLSGIWRLFKKRKRKQKEHEVHALRPNPHPFRPCATPAPLASATRGSDWWRSRGVLARLI